MSFIISLTRPSDSASELFAEGVTWMGVLAAQGWECGEQGQSSESTGDEIQPTTYRLKHFLLCPTPALVQNMKLESSVAPTAWFWARGVVHLVETCMNDTK